MICRTVGDPRGNRNNTGTLVTPTLVVTVAHNRGWYSKDKPFVIVGKNKDHSDSEVIDVVHWENRFFSIDDDWGFYVLERPVRPDMEPAFVTNVLLSIPSFVYPPSNEHRGSGINGNDTRGLSEAQMGFDGPTVFTWPSRFWDEKTAQSINNYMGIVGDSGSGVFLNASMADRPVLIGSVRTATSGTLLHEKAWEFVKNKRPDEYEQLRFAEETVPPRTGGTVPDPNDPGSGDNDLRTPISEPQLPGGPGQKGPRPPLN